MQNAPYREFLARTLPRPPWRPGASRVLTATLTLAGTLAVAVPAAALTPPSSAATGRLVPVGAVPALPSGARVTGALPGTAEVSGAVALRLRDPAAVTAFIGAVSSPRSPSYHKYLARGEFTRRFGPSAAAVAAVERQLRGDGLTVRGVSANRLLVSFAGTAATAEAAFHTGLRRVVLAGGGTGQATTSAVRLPASIAPDVTAVIGLDRLVSEHSAAAAARRAPAAAAHPAAAMPAARGGGPGACVAAKALQADGALTLEQVAASYGLDPLYQAGDLAAAQTIDVIEYEPFEVSDIAAFDRCYFGTDHTGQVTVTSVDGGPGTGPGSGEAALDVEDISALAPAAKIHVFQAPNGNGMFSGLDDVNAIAEADDASQVTTSWGLCEAALQQGAPGAQQVENEIFEQTAAQGQTVFAAAGDDGSDSCAYHGPAAVAPDLSLLDPGSQPYVTSVGGTTVTDVAQPPLETVWNNGNSGGAGGGGISASWAMPPWQDSAAVPQAAADQACSNDPSGTADNNHVLGIPTTLPVGTACRETPDVSALADPQTGPTIFFNGSWAQYGGTSSAAPMWAAMLAEINASSGCSMPHGTGFADPLLYQVASASAAGYAAAFNDVTSGNNDNLGVGGALDYPAGPGYDLATGLGTPRVTNADGTPGLAAQLCAAAGNPTRAPLVASLTPVGPHSVAGGGILQIRGANFGTAAGSVFFGDVRARVATWSAGFIAVVVPPYYVPGGTPSGFAGRANVTVVTAGTPHQSSAPGGASVYQYTADSAGSPAVDYVSSPNGPLAGGNTVHVIGAALARASSVRFGDVPATSFTVLSDNDISATVPASDGNCATPAAQGVCAVAVTVTTPFGTSSGPSIRPAYQGPVVFAPNGAYAVPAACGCEIAAAPQEYDYAAAPVITSVSPAFASENGGSAVVISGRGFNLLTFEYANVGPAGPESSQDFSIVGVTPTQLAITIPAAPEAATVEPLAVPLSVLSAGQLSNVWTLGYAGTPALTSISKHLAGQAAPGSLTIAGRGLAAVTSVVFQPQGALGLYPSTSTAISAQTDTSLAVAIPQTFEVPVDVLACSATGCSAADPAVDTLLLVYEGRPAVKSSSPASGPARGGTTVTIQGALDSEVKTVFFGSVHAKILSQPSLAPSGPVTVLAPPGRAGTTVSISITTLGGELAGRPRSAVTPAAVFTYQGCAPAPSIRPQAELIRHHPQ